MLWNLKSLKIWRFVILIVWVQMCVLCMSVGMSIFKMDFEHCIVCTVKNKKQVTENY
jgi:hypothetical protein